MNKLGTAILAGAIATAFAAPASAQTDTPRDANRPPAELVTPPPVSPRDQPDRKDIEKDRTDADLAIERKCGELAEEARERCLAAARAQRDRSLPSGGAAATPPPPSPTPSAPPSSSSTNPSPSGGGTGGSATPPAGTGRR